MTDITNIPLNKLTSWEGNVRKTQNVLTGYSYQNLLSYTVKGKLLTYNLRGQKASPSSMWLIYDGDDAVAYPAGKVSNNDYPDYIEDVSSQFVLI